MKLPDHFKNKDTLTAVIDNYFTLVLNDDKKAAPPTVAGLALHLGFNSKEDFDIYETKGRFASLIKRARFKVMAYYETRLHYPAPTGAMFALKCMGWHEKIKVRKATSRAKTIKVKLVESGPEPASSEKDINLNKQ